MESKEDNRQKTTEIRDEELTKRITHTPVHQKYEEYFVNKKGEKEGLYIKYSVHGRKVYEATYKSGVLDGIEKRWWYDESEKINKTFNTCEHNEGKYKSAYVEILVPEDAKRVTPADTDYSFKSRISHGKVMSIIDEQNNKYDYAVSMIYTDNKVTYRVGEVVFPDEFDSNPEIDCSHGIHVLRYRDQCEKWFMNFYL
jgi:hypothetical protein